MDFLNMDKARVYAMALPDDISATRHEVVEKGKLWRGWMGTVYGQRVGTEKGFKFETFEQAKANACLFVEQCRAIPAKTPSEA